MKTGNCNLPFVRLGQGVDVVWLFYIRLTSLFQEKNSIIYQLNSNLIKNHNISDKSPINHM